VVSGLVLETTFLFNFFTMKYIIMEILNHCMKGLTRSGSLLLIMWTLVQPVYGQKNDALSIAQSVLNVQADAWNQGDIDSFMKTYWKSPDLQFISSNGMAQGWQATIERYHRTYPDRQAMGKLTFTLNRADRRSKNIITLVGKYHLDREGLDNLEGLFVLVLQRFQGDWKIVMDSTH